MNTYFLYTTAAINSSHLKPKQSFLILYSFNKLLSNALSETKFFFTYNTI